MLIQPMFNYVVILPESKIEKTEGGIIIPEKYQGALKQRSFGQVKAIGPGAPDMNGNIVAMTVKVGERVIYNKNKGPDITEIEDDNKTTYLIMPEAYLIAKDIGKK